MNRKFVPFVILGIVTYVIILFVVGSSFASRYMEQEKLTIDQVEVGSTDQNSGEMEVVVSGDGFDDDTRVILSADTGNRYALGEGIPILGSATGLVMVDDMIYVANTQFGLQALTFENPLRPTLVKTYPNDGGPVAISKDSDRLFMTSAREGVVIYDRSDPHELRQLATVKVDGHTLASQAKDDVLFVALDNNGVNIIDISQLSSKRSIYPSIGTINPAARVLDIVLNNDILYVVTDTSGLLIYDTSPHEVPRLLHTLTMEKPITALSVVGSTLYLGTNQGDIFLFDMSDPEKPLLTGGSNFGGKPVSFTIRGDRLYLADSAKGLVVLDISDPNHIEMIGIVETPGQARAILLYDNLAYVSCNTMGLQVVNLDSIEKPQIRSSVNTSGSVHDLLLDGEWLYVADFYSLKVIRRSNTGEMNIVASLPTDSYVRTFIKNENYLYLSDGKQGLCIVDVSDPLIPKKISQLDLPGTSGPLIKVGNRLFIAAYRGGLHIVDITDPERPWLVETVRLAGKVRDVATDGRFLYAASLQGSIQIYDLDSDQNLTWIAEIVQPWPLRQFSNALALEVKDGLLYVACGKNGLQIFDVKNPFRANLLSTIALPGTIRRLKIEGELVFAVDSFKGLYLVDISNPERPQSLGCVLARKGLHGIQPAGNSLLLGSGPSGVIEVFRPIELKNISLEGSRQITVKVPYPGSDGRYSLHISGHEHQESFYGVLDYSTQ